MWGETTTGTPQSSDYAMNPQITQNSQYSAGLEQDLLSLPTVSITTDIPNMWSATQSASTNPGIYTNEENLTQTGGVSMVVPASFEYFNSAARSACSRTSACKWKAGPHATRSTSCIISAWSSRPIMGRRR